MQQTGTLKKRRRRNLAKVNGLGTVPYDENMDNFTGRDMYSSEPVQDQNPFTIRTGNDTRLRFSASQMVDTRREAAAHSGRVTRDPSYHNPNGIVIDEIDYYMDKRLNTNNSGRSNGLGPLDKRAFVEESIRGRSRFIDNHAMQRLKQLIFLGITTGSFPWYWSEKKHKVERWSPLLEKLWWFQWFFVSIQTTCLTCFQLYAFLESFKAGHKSYREVFMSSFSFLWYSYAMYFNFNLYFYKEKTREYINTLFDFNHSYVEKYLIHLEDYEDGGRWVINCAIISNITQVFVSVSLFLVMPFQPWYLFSYIYPKPWYWLIPGAFQEFMVVGQVITSYMLNSWIVVGHSNTLSFWLRECHNHNDTDYTSDELRTPRRALETYRALEILNKCFNECMAPLAIPMVKIVMSTAMVPCGYVLIRSMNHTFIDEFPGILTYPLGVLDCATAGFVIMSMAAEVFDLGCSFIDSWSRTRQKDFRRILMSCPTMKIWVGRFYFLTLSTTVTFFKVVFDIITDCIITFP